MFTRQTKIKLDARSTEQLTTVIGSENLPLLPHQNRLPEGTVITLMHTPPSRNSKLVGFERGRNRLQPFVGPKEF